MTREQHDEMKSRFSQGTTQADFIYALYVSEIEIYGELVSQYHDNSSAFVSEGQSSSEAKTYPEFYDKFFALHGLSSIKRQIPDLLKVQVCRKIAYLEYLTSLYVWIGYTDEERDLYLKYNLCKDLLDDSKTDFSKYSRFKRDPCFVGVMDANSSLDNRRKSALCFLQSERVFR